MVWFIWFKQIAECRFLNSSFSCSVRYPFLVLKKHSQWYWQYEAKSFLPPFRGKNERSTSGLQCAMRVYYREGLRGFYRGVTASYAGVTETVIHFVLYEALKQRLREHQLLLTPAVVLSPNAQDFCGLMAAAAVSKTCASCIAYPHGELLWAPCSPLNPSDHNKSFLPSLHSFSVLFSIEVVRTRLREEGYRYRSFVQTLQLVAREEGPLALYRGLSAHLLRQIPNAAIVMVTYELIIHLATKKWYLFILARWLKLLKALKGIVA